MAANVREILAAFNLLLINDTVLTNSATGLLPLFGPDGMTASRANAIFYPRPTIPRVFPCITVADVASKASVRDQQERRNRRPLLAVDVEVWGESGGGGTASDLGAITTEIDALLDAGPWWNGAMDTADWQFNDIDTGDQWRVQTLQDETTSRLIERRFKTYWVNAADKTG